MIFELVQDFAAALSAMPKDHPRHRILTLLEEAIRRDIQFIDRHPTTLFQCMWNLCWYYDCPEAAEHFDPPEGGWQPEGPPWERWGPKLYALLESWRTAKEESTPRFCWVRSLRPHPLLSGASPVVVLRGHLCPVQCVGFSPDGEQIVSGSAYLVNEGSFPPSEIPIWHRGKRIAVSAPVASPYPSADNTVRLWDSWAGKQLECFASPDGPINCCTFSPDGEHIAYSGSRRGTVQVIQATGGAEVARFEGHKTTVCRVVYSPDGRWLASASQDGTIQIREARTGADMGCLRGHKAAVLAVAFSPDGKLIASGSASAAIPGDNSLRIWDVVTGQQLYCVERRPLCGIMSVAFSPDSLWVVAGSTDHKVLLYTIADGLKEEVLGTHGVYGSSVVSDRGGGVTFGTRGGEVLSVAFDPVGGRVVSGSTDFTVRVWDVLERRELVCLRGHQDIVNSVAFSPDGRRIVSGSADRTARVWEAVFAKDSARLRDHQSDIVDLTFSADGERILSASRDGTLRLWDFSGVLLRVFADHPLVRKIALSRDGQRIFSTDNRVIRIRPASGGQARSVGYRSDNVDITDFVISDDGERVIGGSWDGKIRVWNAADGTEVCCLCDPNEEVVGLSFLAQENRMIYAQEITSLALSPDGQRIASGSADGTVRLWEMASMRGNGHRGHRAPISSIVWSPDGTLVASGGADGELVLWAPLGGSSLKHVHAHSDAVIRIAFGPDSKSLVSASPTQTVRIPDLATEGMEILEGNGDVSALATDWARAQPWAMVGELETAINSPAAGRAVARFPFPLACLRSHPKGRLWTGAEDNHLHLFVLEGIMPEGCIADRLQSPAALAKAISSADARPRRLASSPTSESFEVPDGTIPESVVPSPDSCRAAYVVRNLSGGHVEVSGRKQRDYDAIAGLTWSADSTRVAYAAMREGRWFVVCEEKELGPHGNIGKTSPVISPDSKRIAYVALQGERAFAVVDGEIIGGPYEGFSPGGMVFSPDSRQVAYVIKRGDAWVVVVNGKEYRSHHNTLERSLVFSPDSKHLAYIACARESGLFARRMKAFLVVDSQPGPAWDHDEKSRQSGVSSEIIFSPDSQRIAYAVGRNGKWSWIVDGTAQRSHDGFVSGWGANMDWHGFPDHGKTCCRPQSLTYSPDSRHFAYAAAEGGQHVLIYDGEECGRHSAITNWPVVFSPDSDRLAYAAEEGGRQFMVLDWAPLKRHFGVSGHREFSPDSTQLAYVCMESPADFHLVVGAKSWQMPGGPLIGARLAWDNADTCHTLIGNGRRITVFRYRLR